jgi:replicative DNA helicase
MYNKQGSMWYKWPFDVIDKYTQGIIPWMVYMICAYSNVGKSAFSYAYVCDLLKKGKKVVFFSLEVTKWVLMTNIIRCYYNKNQQEIMNPDFYFEMWDFENLKVYDDKKKLEDIKNTTRAEKPDVVFIDFVQNIESLGKSEYENMTTCWKEIQALAIETNATIFNISQVSNESRYKTDSMQPKWSWQLFFSSDVIVWLYKDNWMYAHLMKNKFWPNDKKFLVNPDFAKLQFKVVEDFDNSNNNDLKL